MQKAIHPKSNEIKISCASCGNSFATISTKPQKEVTVDICSQCHPFYIGSKQQTAMRGRAEKLSSKFEAAKAPKVKTAAKPEPKKDKQPKVLDSLKDITKLS